jgi:hypothetical protein
VVCRGGSESSLLLLGVFIICCAIIVSSGVFVFDFHFQLSLNRLVQRTVSLPWGQAGEQYEIMASKWLCVETINKRFFSKQAWK